MCYSIRIHCNINTCICSNGLAKIFLIKKLYNNAKPLVIIYNTFHISILHITYSMHINMKKIDTTKDGEITKKNKSRKEKSIEGNRDAGSQSEGGGVERVYIMTP